MDMKIKKGFIPGGGARIPDPLQDKVIIHNGVTLHIWISISSCRV